MHSYDNSRQTLIFSVRTCFMQRSVAGARPDAGGGLRLPTDQFLKVAAESRLQPRLIAGPRPPGPPVYKGSRVCQLGWGGPSEAGCPELICRHRPGYLPIAGGPRPLGISGTMAVCPRQDQVPGQRWQGKHEDVYGLLVIN